MVIRRKRKKQQQEYYYVSLPTKNYLEEGKLAAERIGKLGIDVEFSLSPSKAICYRVRREDVKPGVGLPERPVDQYNKIPYGLPAGHTYNDGVGPQSSWPFREENEMYYLFDTWEKIPRAPGPRRRAKVPTIEPPATRRRRRVKQG